MHQQLSFPDLEPDAERFPVDVVPSQGGRLHRYTLLLALFPPAEATERIDAVAADLVARHSITGSRTAPGRLHVTLHEIAQFASGPDVPAAPIKASIAACDRIAGRAFQVSCSAVGTYPHSNAFVLHCDAATNDAIAALRDAIQVELRRFNLRPRASKDAHMTLVYGARQPQPKVPIEPVRWTATRFALVLSHVGVTHHQWIKEWALGVNEVAG
jgi:2'-5' RNA ligase